MNLYNVRIIVAELCIDLLKTVASNDLERHGDHPGRVAATIREAEEPERC